MRPTILSPGGSDSPTMVTEKPLGDKITDQRDDSEDLHTSTGAHSAFYLNTQQGERNNLPRLSPRKPRNMKNLSLDLGQPQGQATESVPQARSLEKPPSLYRSRTGSNSLPFRHPSLSIHQKSEDPERPVGLQRRRTTLALTIPTRNIRVSSEELSTGNVLFQQQDSSSSPITTASPLVPATPDDLHAASSSSTRSLPRDASLKDDLPQSLSKSIGNLEIGDDWKFDSHRADAYTDGPACVVGKYLYLYSEPTFDQIKGFDLVINCAKELQDYTGRIQTDGSVRTNYIFVPWSHTSQLCRDFVKLVPIIEDYVAARKKVLIHCQCGVSRSASLVVAYVMKSQNLGLNDAYNEVKSKAPLISPNMTLIFQLMEWNNILQGKKPSESNASTPVAEVSSIDATTTSTLNALRKQQELTRSPTASEVTN